MREEKLTVVLALDPTSLIDARGKIKMEVLNSVVRQTRALSNNCNVLIFLFHAALYCQSWSTGNNLRMAFGKTHINKIFSDAFSRREMEICLLDCDVSNFKVSMQEAFLCDVVPIVVCSAANNKDVNRFASFCITSDVDAIIIAGSKQEIIARKDEISQLFPGTMKPRFALHYEPDFFLQSMKEEQQRVKYMFE